MVHLHGRTRALLALALAALLTLTALGAAPGATAAETASISGRVTDTSTSGVADVEVMAYRHNGIGWGPLLNTITHTDALGNYLMGGLPAGSYRLRFEAPSDALALEYYDDATSVSSATDIVVADGAAVTGKNVTLDPAAHITGTVTGSGNPLPGAEVVVYADPGSGTWSPMGSDLTDANGDYDVTGLVDGTYRVEFQDDSRAHVREWYSDAAKLTLADDVVVGKSQTVADIDADLVAAGRLGGTVTGPDGLPVAQVMVTPYWFVGGTWEFVGEDLIDLFIYSDSSGRYEVKGLPAGVYRLEFLDIHSKYPVEFWKDQATLQTATDIVLGPAQTLGNISPTLGAVAVPPAPPAPLAVALRSKPRIKGTARVGEVVKVTTGSWTPAAVTLAYQWYAGSKKIKKATHKKLKLTTKQVGKKLTVKVTASRAGYVPLTVRTKPTGKVKP